MLWEILLNSILEIFSFLLGWIEIPSIDSIDDIINVVQLAVDNGFGIFSFFIDKNLCGTLLGIAMGVCLGDALYKFIMFMLRKIPILGIK